MTASTTSQVLLVSRDTTLIENVTAAVPPTAFQLSVATTATDAAAMVKAHELLAILVDQGLPNLEAFATLRAVRNLPDGRRLPFLFIATTDSQDDVPVGDDIGPIDVLSRSLPNAVLTNKLRWLRDITTTQDAMQKTPPLQPHVPEDAEAVATVVDLVDIAVMLVSPDGTITYVNRAFETLYGYPRTEATGAHTRILNSGRHEQTFYRRMWNTINRGDTWLGQLVNRREDDSLVEVDCQIIPRTSPSGDIIGFAALATELCNQTIDVRSRQAQKMEALGRLAGGVAHDFNNLLSIIMGYSQLLLMQTNGDESNKNKVEQIYRAGERASALTRQLLIFSRKQVFNPVALDLNAVIDGMEKMLGRLIGDHIELRVEREDRLNIVKADTGQIEQIILNLVVNARDAMPDGGQITIRTYNSQCATMRDETALKMEAGDYIVLAVEDSGCGMTPEVRAQIFEPFFTTKGEDQGTGLGLATVYGIVMQSGGAIEVDSQVSHGTTFSVHFPRFYNDAEILDVTETQSGVPSGTETILLVEDQPELRGLLRDFMVARGYTVLPAGDGEEALAQFEQVKGNVDLILTDVVMPGLNANKFTELLQPTKAGMKILYMSGYSNEAMIKRGLLKENAEFLQKPFSPMDLARKVRAVLDEACVGASA